MSNKALIHVGRHEADKAHEPSNEKTQANQRHNPTSSRVGLQLLHGLHKLGIKDFVLTHGDATNRSHLTAPGGHAGTIKSDQGDLHRPQISTLSLWATRRQSWLQQGQQITCIDVFHIVN